MNFNFFRPVQALWVKSHSVFTVPLHSTDLQTVIFGARLDTYQTHVKAFVPKWTLNTHVAHFFVQKVGEPGLKTHKLAS